MTSEPTRNGTGTGPANGQRAQPRTSRPRTTDQAAPRAGLELQLGDFQDVPTFSLSEAKLVINSVLDKRRQAGIPFQETETLNNMLEYLDMFSRFKNKEHITAVDSLLAVHRSLAPFERSQLASLCCETPDEAKTLIPSLQNKISDDELKELLEEISRVRTFGRADI